MCVCVYVNPLFVASTEGIISYYAKYIPDLSFIHGWDSINIKLVVKLTSALRFDSDRNVFLEGFLPPYQTEWL